MLQHMDNHIKIRELLLIISITLFSLTAYSQNITYKKDWQGNTIAVDNMGNTIATQKKDWQGNLIWVDNQGNTIKTQKKDWQGNLIWVDPQGNTINTQKQDWQGNKIIVNTSGQTEYVYKKDWQGNTAVYDSRGELVGTYKKDWQGNTVFVGESPVYNSSPSYNPYIAQSPPKFSPYIPENPIFYLTPEERAAYYAAKARREQQTAEALASGLELLASAFKVSPEVKYQRLQNQQKEAAIRQEKTQQRKEARKIYFGTEAYYKTIKTKKMWLGSALISAGIGTLSYLNANSLSNKYSTATTNANSIYNQSILFNNVSTVAYGVALFSSMKFILKLNRLKKVTNQTTSVNILPYKNGTKMSLAYKF